MAYEPIPSKAEDSTHVDGDLGIPFLGVRRDADTSPVSADGDYHSLIFNNIGRAKVSVLPAATAITTGTLASSTATVSADVSHESYAIIMITGTFTGFNGTFEASIDGGTTYFGIQVSRSTTGVIDTVTGVLGAAPAYAWRVNANGYTNIRLRATALTTGSVSVSISFGAFAVDNVPSVALQSSTNTIGAISSIGTSVVPGVGATNLGKAEDAAHASGDTGVQMLAVRNDGGATALTSANGDYSPVAVSPDGSQHVVQKAATAAVTSPSTSTTSATLLAANVARKGATIYNDSAAVLYVKFGATASSTSFTVPLAANAYYEVPGGYTGIIDGILVSGTGAGRVTELT